MGFQRFVPCHHTDNTSFSCHPLRTHRSMSRHPLPLIVHMYPNVLLHTNIFIYSQRHDSNSDECIYNAGKSLKRAIAEPNNLELSPPKFAPCPPMPCEGACMGTVSFSISPGTCAFRGKMPLHTQHTVSRISMSWGPAWKPRVTMVAVELVSVVQ